MKRARTLAFALAALSWPVPKGAMAEGAESPSTNLRARVGIAAAEASLASPDASERVRGLERLAATGTARAVERLVRALAPGGGAESAEERLTAVRALAPHAADPAPRRALARALFGHVGEAAGAAPFGLDQTMQETAALALSRSGTREALAALGKALETGGRAAAAATIALVAHPPRDLGPLVAGRGRPSVDLAAALGRLGDQRSRQALRSMVQTGTAEVRAVAAIALAGLGDYEAVELGRRWAGSAAEPALRIAGARLLALAHASDAPAAIARLLEEASTAEAALTLALEAPHPALVPALGRRLARAEGETLDEVIRAIGRAGGPSAVALLSGLLADEGRGALAAHALGRMPERAARDALGRALGRPETRRLATRAATLRLLVLDDEVAGFEEAASGLFRSRDAGARAAGAAGLAALDPTRLAALVASPDPAIVEGAASLLLLGDEHAAGRAADRLAGSRGAATPALALSLAFPSARRRVPTAALERLYDEGGPAAPLAARALAERDEPGSLPRLERLLSQGDPWIRAQTALGLGQNPASHAVGLLSDAYRFETVPAVRAAIVRGLSGRAEPTRTRTLSLAADLDASEEARALSRRALGGARLGEPEGGDAVVWLPVAESGTNAAPRGAAVTVAAPGGFIASAAVGRDGLVILPGLPHGPLDLRVALPEEPGNHP